MFERLVDQFSQLPFCHDNVRAQEVRLLVAAKFEESGELPGGGHDTCLQFLEALGRVSHQVHDFGGHIIEIFLYTDVHNVTNLIKNIATEAFRHHDVIYLFVITVVALLVDELVGQDAFRIQVVGLIANLRMFLHVFHHLSNVFHIVVLSDAEWVGLVFALVIELHIDGIDNARIDTIQIYALVFVNTSLF